MRKMIALFALTGILCSFAFFTCGCGSFLRLLETEIYNKTLDDFFNALDSGNPDDILSLFSENARQSDADIKEQIYKMISEYPRSKTTLPQNICHAGSYESGDGLFVSSTSATFPVTSNGQYYWFCIDLTYEDDISPDNIGIRQIIFFTDDEYYSFWHQGTHLPATDGLYVYAEQNPDIEIRCIDQCPYAYTPIARTLTLSAVEDHIAKEKDFSKFIEKFGQPNATEDGYEWHYYYYELDIPDEHIAYLELGVDIQSNQIVHAFVESDMNFVKSIYEVDE